MNTTEIRILPELKALIPPLTPEEFSQLEQNCIAEGIRDPLVIACFPDEETGEALEVLADGHNRHSIAQKHNLHFEVRSIQFDNLDSVRQWMDENQIGRRNLHPKHFKILLGRIYNRRKKDSRGGGDRGNQYTGGKVTKNVTLAKTHQQIASKFGVGEQTVINAGQQQKILSDLAAETGKSEFELIDEIGKDKHLNKIHQRKKKEPEKPVSLIADEVLSEAKEREEKQQERRVEVKETLKKLSLLDVVGSKRYRVIYADPPWQYNDSKKIDGYSGTDDHYITMPLEVICQMPVRQITEENAVLFLWVTSPFLEDCFKVINSWGFKYKSSFIWNKVRHNMGHYNSVRHEFLLIATKGSCTPDENRLFNSVQEVERTANHSEKPEEFREIIDTLYTWGNKLEVFGRKDIEGWDVFGNQKLQENGSLVG